MPRRDVDVLQDYVNESEKRERRKQFRIRTINGLSLLALLATIIVSVPIVFNPVWQIYVLHRENAAYAAFSVFLLTGVCLIALVGFVMQVKVDRQSMIRDSAVLAVALGLSMLTSMVGTGISIFLDYNTLDIAPTGRSFYYLARRDRIGTAEPTYELWRCEPLGMLCRQETWAGPEIYNDDVRVIIVPQFGPDDQFRLAPLAE